jgi:stage II sporulation protein M
MLPWAIIGYLGYQLGAGSLGFLLTAVLPHGIVEIPAVLIAAAAALRWHAVFLSAPQGLTLSERWLRAGTDFARLFVAVVIPLLLIAAFLEAYVTPALLLQLFGK